MTQYIRIKDIPPGDAPEVNRKAWVGLVLPVMRFVHDEDHEHVVGIISGKPDYENKQGYMVDGQVAVDALRQKDPEGAKFWEELSPFFVTLVFAEAACEVVIR